MRSFAFGPTLLLRLDPGEEIVSALRAFCARERIAAGALRGIGSVSAAVLGWYDRPGRAYVETRLEGDRELASLLGNVSLDAAGGTRVHAHAVLSDRAGETRAGHLVSGTVAVTCEVWLTRFADEIRRVEDPATGAEILDLEP